MLELEGSGGSGLGGLARHGMLHVAVVATMQHVTGAGQPVLDGSGRESAFHDCMTCCSAVQQSWRFVSVQRIMCSVGERLGDEAWSLLCQGQLVTGHIREVASSGCRVQRCFALVWHIEGWRDRGLQLLASVSSRACCHKRRCCHAPIMQVVKQRLHVAPCVI